VEVGPVQALFRSRRHRADAPSAVDSAQLREVPRGETALTAVFVEAIESGLALCDEVNPIPAPGQRILLSDPARRRMPPSGPDSPRTLTRYTLR